MYENKQSLANRGDESVMRMDEARIRLAVVMNAVDGGVNQARYREPTEICISYSVHVHPDAAVDMNVFLQIVHQRPRRHHVDDGRLQRFPVILP